MSKYKRYNPTFKGDVVVGRSYRCRIDGATRIVFPYSIGNKFIYLLYVDFRPKVHKLTVKEFTASIYKEDDYDFASGIVKMEKLFEQYYSNRADITFPKNLRKAIELAKQL